MDLKERIKEFPPKPGVYLMKDDRGRVIYIGKAKSLKHRVTSYFHGGRAPGPRVEAMVSQVADVDYLEAQSEVDALLLEARLVKDIQPRYNVNLKDDKSYPYLEITRRQDFPRVRITREPAKSSKVYGPFIDVDGLRAALPILQRIFKFSTCNMDIRADDDKRRFQRPCLLYYIGQCSAPCADKISREDYAENIRALIKFLEGKQRSLIRELTAKMQHAATKLEYEKAGALRDRIKALKALSKRGLYSQYGPADYVVADPKKAMAALQKVFNLEELPRTIEGIDIAQIGGAEAVGSLVSFIDGKPFKAGYRRFRIKTVKKSDDYAMVREVVLRWFKRLKDEESIFPDILLIDGGLGHLEAARAVLEDLKVKVPLLVSLAKREEEIYREGAHQPMRLSRTSPALKVLQYVRDEAHRFAQHYHHILRHKKTFAEVKKRQKKSRKKRTKAAR